MAIDPRISLAVQVPDVSKALNIFESTLTNNQNRKIAKAQEGRRAAQAPLDAQEQKQRIDINQGAIDEQTENRIIRSVAEFGIKLKPILESGNTEQAIASLTQRARDLQDQNLPVDQTIEAIQSLQQGDVQGVLGGIDVAQQLAQQRGLFGNNVSLSQREFNSNVEAVKADPELKTTKGKAAAVALGIEARASTSAQERIATDPELTDAVATSEAIIEGATSEAREGSKLEQQRKHKPEIARAVKLAEKAATEQGDVLTEVARMEASLPGIKEVVNELVELSSIATSTFAGRLFDSAVKESGFGSTKGADAKAKLIAIVDNQVLPLLKETFGAAFTVQEGENLKASLVDPNASPSQKRQQLDAFIAQKERNLRTKQTQLDQEKPALNTTIIRFDAKGNKI